MDTHDDEVIQSENNASTSGHSGSHGLDARAAETLVGALARSPVSLVVADVDGTITWVNRYFEELTGYTADEVIGRNPRLLQSGLTPPHEYVIMWRTVRSGREWTGEFANRRKDGTVYRERATIIPLTDEDETINGYVAIKQNITEEYTARADLQRSERRFRHLFERAADAIYLHDGAGIIVSANREAMSQTGYTLEELIGMPIGHLDAKWRFEPPPEVTAAIRPDGSIDPTAIPRAFETLHRRADGGTFEVEVRPFLVEETEGRVLIGTMVRDISALKAATAELRTSLEEKETLLRELHHRVKNNLQSIASLLTLQRDDISDPDVATLLEANVERVHSMALVHQSLYQSEHLHTIEFDEYARTLLRYRVESRALRNRVPEIRFTADPVTLPLDTATPLAMALNELVANALMYPIAAGDESSPTWMEVTLAVSEGSLRVRVRDSGTASSATLMRERHGLGLELVELLTDQIGGSLQTTDESGSDFTIVLAIPPPR